MRKRCKQTIRPGAATIIGGCDDLLTEILVFLPAKSLIRFKSVSKHWDSVISAPNFSHHHRRRRHLNKSDHSFILGRQLPFFYFNPISKSFVPYGFEFPSTTSTTILKYCNGLLLLECRKLPRGRKNYYVCNPTTGQLRNLFFKKAGGSKSSAQLSGFSLAFDPWKSPHYKVVCVTNMRYRMYRFDLYDSESHTWKSLGEHLIKCASPYFDHGRYWKNRIYWEQFFEVIYLDLEKGDLRSIQGKMYTVFNQRFIQKSKGGHIHSVDVDLQHKVELLSNHDLFSSDKTRSFAFYFANPCSTTYSEFWANPMLAASTEMTNPIITFLGIMRGEQEEGVCEGTEEDFSVAFHVPGKIASYRFSDGNFEVLLDLISHDIFQEDELQFKHTDIAQFIESLALV